VQQSPLVDDWDPHNSTLTTMNALVPITIRVPVGRNAASC